MLRCRGTLLDDVEHFGELRVHQRLHVEPQSWKPAATVDAIFARQPHELLAFENEPVDLAIQNAPDDVFLDPIASIGFELRVEIMAYAAGRDFADPFGSADDVAAFKSHLTTML